MTVYRHKSGKWAYDFVCNGRRYFDYGYRLKSDAATAEAEHRKQLRAPYKMPPGMIDFGTLCNAYLDYCEGFNSPRAYDNKKSVIARQFKKWADMPASAITQAMIEEHMIERKEKSAGTANQDRKWLHGIFSWAQARGYVEYNPVAKVRRVPEGRRKPVYIPPDADIEAVLREANPQRRDMIVLQQHLIARGHEISRLQWDDVDIDNRQVRIWSSKSAGGHAISRQVWANDTALEILTRLRRERRSGCPWVFPCPTTGEPYRDRHWLLYLCRKAGVKPFGTHALRHYSASRLLDGRHSPKLIQNILGHSQFATTERYLHLLAGSEEMQRAMQSLESDSHKSPIKKPPHKSRKAARKKRAGAA
jgi:integrase